MLLSAVSILVVAQSSSEIPEGLMNNPVYVHAAYYQLLENSVFGVRAVSNVSLHILGHGCSMVQIYIYILLILH